MSILCFLRQRSLAHDGVVSAVRTIPIVEVHMWIKIHNARKRQNSLVEVSRIWIILNYSLFICV